MTASGWVLLSSLYRWENQRWWWLKIIQLEGGCAGTRTWMPQLPAMVLFSLTIPNLVLYEYLIPYLKATHYKVKRRGEGTTRGLFYIWTWLKGDSSETGTEGVSHPSWASSGLQPRLLKAPSFSADGRTWWKRTAGPTQPCLLSCLWPKIGQEGHLHRDRQVHWFCSKGEFEVIVRDLHLLLSKLLGQQRNESPVNPGRMFGGKWRQNTWSGRHLVLPQAIAWADMKASTGFQRLEPASGAISKRWNGFNHCFLAMPTFFCIGCHLFIFIFLYLVLKFPLMSLTGTYVKVISAASQVVSRAPRLLCTPWNLMKNTVDVDNPGASCWNWGLPPTHPGSRRAAELGQVETGISKILFLCLCPPTANNFVFSWDDLVWRPRGGSRILKVGSELACFCKDPFLPD